MFFAYSLQMLTISVERDFMSSAVSNIDWFILFCFLLAICKCRKLKKQNEAMSQQVKELEAELTSLKQQKTNTEEQME